MKTTFEWRGVISTKMDQAPKGDRILVWDSIEEQWTHCERIGDEFIDCEFGSALTQPTAWTADLPDPWKVI